MCKCSKTCPFVQVSSRYNSLGFVCFTTYFCGIPLLRAWQRAFWVLVRCRFSFYCLGSGAWARGVAAGGLQRPLTRCFCRCGQLLRCAGCAAQAALFARFVAWGFLVLKFGGTIILQAWEKPPDMVGAQNFAPAVTLQYKKTKTIQSGLCLMALWPIAGAI